MALKKTARSRCKDCKVNCRSAFSEIGGLDCAELDSIRKSFKFSAGAGVPLKFGKDSGFLCINRGHVLLEVSLTEESGPLTILGPGDLVGFNCSKSEVRQTVKALEEGEACFFPWSSFRRLQGHSTHVSRGVILKLCEAIVAKDMRITALENDSVKARVAAFLLSLEKKFGMASEHGSRINLKLDRQTFARISGTVAETLSRTLAELEKEHAILREGWDIHVMNPKALQKIAQA